MKPEFRITNGSGTWYPTVTSNAAFAGGNDATLSLQISIDGPNVTARRYKLSFGNTPNQVVSGRVDGDSIRASSKFCTLSLTRDPSSASAAPSQFDGTYTGIAPTTSGQMVRTVRVTVAGGRGSGTLTGPSGDSYFTFSIAPNGKVTGSGDLYRTQGSPTKLPTDVQGEATANGLSLELGGGNRAWLTRGDIATAPATAASPFDGNYQTAMKTGSGSRSPLIVRTINIKVINGVGSGRISTPTAEDAGTFAFEISPSGKIVGKGEGYKLTSSPPTREPIEIQGEAGKDALSLMVSGERVWVPRLRD
jgi:hypothetical protein